MYTQLLFIFLCLLVQGFLCFSLIFRHGFFDRRRGVVVVFLACLAGFGLFRTHEHVFQGLDCSALRLMAQALSEGRPLKGEDPVLPLLEPELRQWTLLTPGVHRITRDRSWQLDSLDSSSDFPFFYPFLPMVASGLDRLLPFDAIDLYVPLTGWLFLLSLMSFLYCRHGIGGSVWGLLVFVACSLPAWIWRGFYLEAPGLALLGSVVLFQLAQSTVRFRHALFMGLGCGLAVSFHPYLLLFSVPFTAWLMWRVEGIRSTFAVLGGFFLGCLPLLFLTCSVTSPYGPMFFHLFSFFPNPVLARVMLYSLLGLSILVYSALAARSHKYQGEGAVVFWPKIGAGSALLLVWGLAFFTPSLWPLFELGLRDFFNATQLPLFLLLLMLLPCVLFAKKDKGLVWIVFIALLTLPAFALLKGSDRMPMWSMRRLLPPLYFFLLGIALVGPEVYQRLRAWRGGVWLQRFALILGGVGCCYVPVRWPAPYMVQFDHGADAFVLQTRQALGNHWTLFEDYPHSVPFSTFPGNRVFAPSLERPDKLPLLVDWFSRQETLDPRFIVSPYSNPGLIPQAALVPLLSQEMELDRLFTRIAALPAFAEERTIRLNVFNVEALSPGVFHSLDRVFDASMLGLSGPWGREDIGVNQGRGEPRLLGRWTREGSRFVGPIPPPGKRLRLEVQAAAQRNDREDQVLLVTLPWDVEPLRLTFSKKLNTVHVVLPKMALEEEYPATGWYTLSSGYPYNPEVEGIRGFKKDLGVMLHRVIITLDEP